LPRSLSPLNKALRTTAPTYTAFFSGKCFVVSGKVANTFFANGIESLLASPGVISDSSINEGTRLNFAAATTGTDTKPPFETITFGFVLPIIRQASQVPFSTLNGSLTFSSDMHLRNLPVETG